MPDIKFHCSECGGSLEVGEAGAGQKINCPLCGMQIHVPHGPFEVRVAAPLQALPEPTRENCPLCEKPIRSDSPKCEHCGEWVKGYFVENQFRTIPRPKYIRGVGQVMTILGFLCCPLGLIVTAAGAMLFRPSRGAVGWAWAAAIFSALIGLCFLLGATMDEVSGKSPPWMGIAIVWIPCGFVLVTLIMILRDKKARLYYAQQILSCPRCSSMKLGFGFWPTTPSCVECGLEIVLERDGESPKTLVVSTGTTRTMAGTQVQIQQPQLAPASANVAAPAVQVPTGQPIVAPLTVPEMIARLRQEYAVIESERKQYNRRSFMFGVPAFILNVFCLFPIILAEEGHVLSREVALCLFFLIGAGAGALYAAAFTNAAKYKGLNPALGFWGLIGIPGGLIILCMRDETSQKLRKLRESLHAMGAAPIPPEIIGGNRGSTPDS